MSRQMQHVSPTDSFYIRVKYTASYLLTLTELVSIYTISSNNTDVTK